MTQREPIRALLVRASTAIATNAELEQKLKVIKNQNLDDDTLVVAVDLEDLLAVVLHLQSNAKVIQDLARKVTKLDNDINNS